MEKEKNDYQKRIITIPNMLSLFRILLLPVIFWFYCIEKDPVKAAIALIVSGLTDMADGFIARRFHMISDLGKMLDPVADKLTQGVTLLCLGVRFPLMWLPLGLFIIKEALNTVLGLLVIKRTGNVHGAKWHGKVTTCLLYAVMILHLLWSNIPKMVSDVSIILCFAVMLMSGILYTIQHLKRLKEK